MTDVPSRIEPCFFEDSIPAVLADLAVEIQREASALGQGLHTDSAAELAEFVRLMNCYYSNLIEGHNTRPKDIERALAGAEVDETQRPLALEAKAHVTVQRKIDEMHARGTLPSPTSVEFIRYVHKAFYEEMPNEFRVVKHPDGTEMEIVPGEFRKTSAQDVAVGRHQPPSSDRVEAFMAHFEGRFGGAEKLASTRIISIATAHHRLNYIHPFTDGNGRVSRLMSHAMAQRFGIGSMGLWSVSRGLARGLKDRGEYKLMMDHADSPRQGPLDGRGNLSAEALKEFSEWFLLVVLDQIRFTKAVFSLETLWERYRDLLLNLGYDARECELVSAVLRYGSLDRGAAGQVMGVSTRTARNSLSKLTRDGFLKSASPKTPVRIAFPLDYRERLFPNLFSDAPIGVPPSPTVTYR